MSDLEVFGNGELTANEKLLLLFVKQWGGTILPSSNEIAKGCGWCRNTSIRVWRGLVEKGILDKKPNFHGQFGVDYVGTVYVIHDVPNNLIKVGWSRDKSARRRIAELAPAHIRKSWKMLHEISGTLQVEGDIHEALSKWRQGNTEWFESSYECLAKLEVHLEELDKESKDD